MVGNSIYYQYTAISREVVKKNVHVTIQKVIWDIINTLFLKL